jgi:hypothetical protein
MKRGAQEETSGRKKHRGMTVLSLSDEPNHAPELFKMLQEKQRGLPFEITDDIIEYRGRLYFPLEIEKLTPLLDNLIYDFIKNGELMYVTDLGTGKDYYNRTNKWYRSKQNDKECDGYAECELEYKDPVGEIQYHVSVPKYKEAILCQFKEITVINVSGVNVDHRGSDHTEILLPAEYSWTIKKPCITVQDLAEAFFRVKSHKFDSWYELYMQDYLQVKLEDGVLTLTARFDHGS